jgi:hypothetical protein
MSRKEGAEAPSPRSSPECSRNQSFHGSWLVEFVDKVEEETRVLPVEIPYFPISFNNKL